ncbi:MAG: hypothetical protein ABI667_10160 [Sphingomicrobium sp.]
MGGWNSGRRSGFPVVEDGLTIDLAKMLRCAWISDTISGSGNLYWSRNGDQFAAIGYAYDMRDPRKAWLTLTFIWTPSDGDEQRVEQRIALTSTSPNYGGRRWWMHCPFTGRRVGKIHMPPGGGKFASRTAWKLSYRSQRSAHRDRPFDKLFRLQRKLRSSEGCEAGLRRPKGMWKSTFERHFRNYLELDSICAAELMAVYRMIE